MGKRLAAIRNAASNNAVTQKPRDAIDIALLFDMTGSMQLWFEEAKKKVREIVNQVNIKYPQQELRMAFVGYRDFGDDGTSPYEVLDFTTASELSLFLDNVSKCDGGFDAAEDVTGGITQILSLSWKSRTRLTVFIADAPGHGIEYQYFNLI